MSFYIYKKKGTSQLPAFEENTKLNDPALYLPSDELTDAVNVALKLGLPLLLTGEPGTGKTQLAYHVAYQFGLGEPLVFNAQTTSLATDLFYRYDALGHFRYNQTSDEKPTESDIESLFIQYNALGEAIKNKKRVVVLIDEIDKAPRDLPNDILFAIEKLSFKVPELNNKAYYTEAANRPIIILTSNSEKNLPDAFLRRVTYFHIPFPNDEQLIEILDSKTDNMPNIEAIVKHFGKIRSLPLKKKPATSEMIYWALLLKDLGLAETFTNLSMDDEKVLIVTYACLGKTKEDREILKKMV